MAKKNTTFADAAKRIQSKYYKYRKPGEDSLSDEAFEREMEFLMRKQESIKPVEEGSQQEFSTGGVLPKYPYPNEGNGYTNFLQRNTSFAPYVDGMDGSPILNNGRTSLQELPQLRGDYDLGLNINKNDGFYPKVDLGLSGQSSSPGDYINPTGLGFGAPEVEGDKSKIAGYGKTKSELNSTKPYSAIANIASPLIAIGTSAIASQMLKKSLDKTKNELLKGVSLGRVNAEQIDLGEERANIASNRDLVASAGNYAANTASSASEAAAIRNTARLGSQRSAGDLLSKSYITEATENQRARERANMTNSELQSRESAMTQDINSRYAGLGDKVWSDFALASGQSVSNWIGESQEMNKDLNRNKVAQPDYDIGYDKWFNGLDKNKQRLARMGLLTPQMNVNARKNEK